MKKYLYYSILSYKDFLRSLFQKLNPSQIKERESFFKKFGGHFLILIILILFSLLSELLPNILKHKEKTVSLDSLIPKDFVLLPIEIINGTDIVNLIGNYGVVDLYAYSGQNQLPEKQAASAVKVLPPDREEGRWTALIPEKQASYLFEYPDPFYAVIQNPKKNSSKIYKKKKKQSLIVIEENF